jgi:hypothetical protein
MAPVGPAKPPRRGSRPRSSRVSAFQPGATIYLITTTPSRQPPRPRPAWPPHAPPRFTSVLPSARRDHLISAPRPAPPHICPPFCQARPSHLSTTPRPAFFQPSPAAPRERGRPGGRLVRRRQPPRHGLQRAARARQQLGGLQNHRCHLQERNKKGSNVRSNHDGEFSSAYTRHTCPLTAQLHACCVLLLLLPGRSGQARCVPPKQSRHLVPPPPAAR